MNESDTTRLNKFIADSGFCSRREADRLIEGGRVTVDGRKAEMGERISPEQDVCVDGTSVTREEETILLVFNKPAGLVCTTSDDEDDNVVKFINYPKRIYPIGRLDKYSEGLLLLTNRGDLVNGIMRSRYNHEKEYVVTVDRPVTEKFLNAMAAGVPILGTTTKQCKTKKLARNKFDMIITQGMNRQIKRMCEYFDYRVMSLRRIRIMNIVLGDLRSGEYRKASEKEIEEILGQKAQ
ncbi:MAG: pseudouridine synthase [Candidatus Methanomethylophilaceae archaeon]|jgi:23S rRNA pseudouridine2604 synthase